MGINIALFALPRPPSAVRPLTSIKFDGCTAILIRLTPCHASLVMNDMKTSAKLMTAMGEGFTSSVPISDSDRGQDIINRMKDNQCWKELQPVAGGRSILTEEQLQEAKACPSESAFIAFMTPFFSVLVNEAHPSLRLFNSEKVTWLWNLSGDPKRNGAPDLMTTHMAFGEYAAVYRNAPNCDGERFFGRFPSPRCVDSINCLWEGKREYAVSDIGEMEVYLSALSIHWKRQYPLVSRGICFSTEGFHMMKVSKDVATHITKCAWTTPGSHEELVSFLKVSDPWFLALEAAVQRHHLTLLIDTTPKACCFLGSGRNGRAFRLQNGQVLKLVVRKSSPPDELPSEYVKMVAAYEKCPELVCRVVENSVVSNQPVGDGEHFYDLYLLAECGLPLAYPLNEDVVLAAAGALVGLHNAGISHGDPRDANLIVVDNKYKWIDLRGGNFGCVTQTDRRFDVKIFLKSFCGVDISDKQSLPPSLLESVQSYVAEPSIAGLATVVTQTMSLTVSTRR